MPSQEDLNKEEATAIVDEAAEVPVGDVCQVRDSNTCKLMSRRGVWCSRLQLFHLQIRLSHQ